MKYTKLFFIVCIIVLGWFSFANFRGVRPAFGPPAGDIAQELEKGAENTTGFPLILPPGFTISVFAKDLGSPRVLAFDPAGTLLASVPSQGKVIALGDPQVTVASGLNRPHGLAFSGNTLYIAETNQVAMYDYDQTTKKASNKKKVVDLPGGGNHFSRTIGFGPDGRLYISVGSSCNVCAEADNRRAAILVADVTGPGPVTHKVFASGLRNSVFFTWRPGTKELWATDMGRDLIGDDIPPDEVNIMREGGFYGWPYCYGKSVRDMTFSEPKGLNLLGWEGVTLSNVCTKSIGSHIDLPAHSAPLGLVFVPAGWPAEYRDDLLVAYHGSWNRSTPTGYKVVRMKLDEKGNYLGTDDFITGWLPTGGGEDGVLGRPVDLLFDSQGALYVSDDKAGVIYRVTQT